MQNLSSVWDTNQPCHDNCISGYVLKYKQKPESHGKKHLKDQNKWQCFLAQLITLKMGYRYTLILHYTRWICKINRLTSVITAPCQMSSTHLSMTLAFTFLGIE